MDNSRRSFFVKGAGFAGSIVALAKSGPTVAYAPPVSAPARADADGAIELPARRIPLPSTISPAARKYLASVASQPFEPTPPLTDKAAWRAHIAAHDAHSFPKSLPDQLPGVDVETRVIGSTTVYVATMHGATGAKRKPHLSIHGGGFTNLGGRPAKLIAQFMAMQYGGEVYAIDYRMPPDHPYPTPLDDCLSVYREFVRMFDPKDILVAGGSAGGNLALAMLLKARDGKLPLPGALFLDTPVTDLTGSSDSVQTNRGIDVFLKQWIEGNIALYANGHDLAHPYLSPINGNYDGFPPTYLRTGTRDLLMSDTVRLHARMRKAGVAADLFVSEAMPHAGFGMRTPEDADNIADTNRWMDRFWRKY